MDEGSWSEEQQREQEDDDTIVWNSAESAKQIKRLGEVEQDIVRLMELASESMSLLALPQTDSNEEAQVLPRGPNRSAAFATNAEQYFQTLNAIQTGMRTSIARVRAARIPPGALKAPEGRAWPNKALGMGLPSANGRAEKGGGEGFQETKVEAEAWKGMARALESVVSSVSSSSSSTAAPARLLGGEYPSIDK